MNLPNKLTLFRIILVPVIILVWLLNIPNVTITLLASEIDVSKFIKCGTCLTKCPFK